MQHWSPLLLPKFLPANNPSILVSFTTILSCLEVVPVPRMLLMLSSPSKHYCGKQELCDTSSPQPLQYLVESVYCATAHSSTHMPVPKLLNYSGKQELYDASSPQPLQYLVESVYCAITVPEPTKLPMHNCGKQKHLM